MGIKSFRNEMLVFSPSPSLWLRLDFTKLHTPSPCFHAPFSWLLVFVNRIYVALVLAPAFKFYASHSIG